MSPPPPFDSPAISSELDSRPIGFAPHGRFVFIATPERQRLYIPLCEGLPGDLPGYDYAGNPCSFASVHFAGLLEKPSDPLTLWLAPQILGRKPEHLICPF